MDKYRIRGGNRLTGEVGISGAKNAVGAILAATLLAEDTCVIENVPNIRDVSISLDILSSLGARVRRLNKNTVTIDPQPAYRHTVPHELGQQMRASYYYIGALLGRCGQARVSMPGGCFLGVRPIDQHLKGFAALGAQIAPMEHAMIDVVAPRLVGNSIYLDMASVGATINIVLAAVKARGLTIIENAAKEPHIVDLANFLNTLGADIRGAGTDVIKVRGVEHLGGATYSIIPDQIEAGTYMAAAAITGGDVLIRNIIPKHLESITAKLQEMGVQVEEFDEAVRVCCTEPLRCCNIKTAPHPGFPTDMQPQFGALLSVAQGNSIITEGVWDNRFRYVEELHRMGAQIQADGKVAMFTGVERLTAAPVRATALRAGAALILAALVADGVTEIDDIQHIERGYDSLVDKMTALGADICRVTYPDGTLSKAI